MFFLKKKKETKDIFYNFENCLNLLNHKIDPRNFVNFTEFKYINKIKFKTPAGTSLEKMKKKVPLETLKIFINNIDGVTLWEAEYDEYRSIYKDNGIAEDVKKFLEPSLNLLKEHKNDVFYQHMILKYELSILTVYQTLTDSNKFNKKITKSLEKSSMRILKKFSAAILRSEVERIEYIKRDVQSFNNSLNERLKLENEYLTKFVDVNK